MKRKMLSNFRTSDNNILWINTKYNNFKITKLKDGDYKFQIREESSSLSWESISSQFLYYKDLESAIFGKINNYEMDYNELD